MNTIDEKEIFNTISNHATKNERITWKRKQKKLTEMIETNISPIELKILELTMQKQAYMDEVVALRDVMVKECVHDKEFLVLKDDHVHCKFCDSKIKTNN